MNGDRLTEDRLKVWPYKRYELWKQSPLYTIPRVLSWEKKTRKKKDLFKLCFLYVFFISRSQFEPKNRSTFVENCKTWPETVFIKKDLHDMLPRLVRLQLKIKVLQYYTV